MANEKALLNLPVASTLYGKQLSNNWEYGDSVASAATIVPTGQVFHVTGTTSIENITGTNLPKGYRITLIFDAASGATDGGNLKLASTLIATADDTLSLVWDGSNWYETGRSVN